MDRKFEQRANGENFPEGIPQEIWEKPGDYEETLPLIKRTVGLVKQFGNTKPNKREALLDQYAQPLVKNPQAWKSLAGNLDLITDLKPEINVAEIKTQLFTRIEALAARRANLAQWTPEKIEELIRLGLDASGELAGTVERMKASIFNAPRTPTEAVALHYNTAWTMIATDDNQIREELFSILCFEKPWFPAHSLGNFYFTLGSNFPDDATMEKYHAVIGALKSAGMLLETKGEFKLATPRRVQQRDFRLLESQSITSETEQIAREKIVLQYVKQNPQRYARIETYVLNKENEIYADLLRPTSPFEALDDADFMAKSRQLKEAKDNPENQTWPKNIIYSRNEPLNVLVRKVFLPKAYRTFWENYQRVAQKRGFEKVTNTPIQLTDDVELGIIAKGPLTHEQKQEVAREVHSALLREDSEISSPRAAQSFAGVIDLVKNLTSVVSDFDKARSIIFNVSLRLPEEEIGRLSSILEYHRPIFTLEQLKAIEDQISHLREDLQKGFTRAVGRRGYTLMISDPFLRRFGYKEITINQASTPNRLHIKMAIDGEEYGFDLDGNYRIILGQDLKQVKNSQDKAWLEVLVLSHLRKLICTSNEEDEIKIELVGGERQYERYRKQVGRAEHLRRQKPGWNYSADAFNKCLKSNLPVKDLHLINRMKAEIGQGGTKETGIWTYVSGAEYVDNPDAKPIKLAFAKASEDMRSVIPLGEVSPEEFNRLEKEILDELGI